MPRIQACRKRYMIEDFPGWVKSKMKQKQIKQETMAKEMGISQACLSNRLNGKAPLNYTEIITIFDVLETPPEDILRWMIIEQ